jgi:uncharacterized protein YciI
MGTQRDRDGAYDRAMVFAMIRKGGPAWDGGRPLREQDKWTEHAAFMDELAAEGFLVMAGPLGDGHPEHRVLLIFDADSEDAIHTRLEADPWTPTGVLTTVSTEPWNVLIGDPSAD